MLPEKHPQFENYICLVKRKKKNSCKKLAWEISLWPNFAPIGLSLFPNVKI